MGQRICMAVFALIFCAAQPGVKLEVGFMKGPFSVQAVSAPPYRAVADGLVVADGTMSSNSTTLTSARGLFTPSAVGKTISVQYAGGTAGSNQPLTTTVAAYIRTTQITLASPSTHAVTAAGVLWGTDNYAAFNSWVAALPGHAGTIPCPSPGAIYLVNLEGEKRTLNLGSNELITMDKACSIAIVGVHIGIDGGLFNIPAGTHNLKFDSPHIIGEWQNTANLNAIRGGFGDGEAFVSENAGGSSNIQILNPLFEHLIGMGVKEFNSNDSNVVIKNVTCNNVAATCLNVNSGTTTIDNYLCTGASTGVGACIEASGAQSLYKNGKSYYSRGQYAMQFGGNTSGSPYIGSRVTNNNVYNFIGVDGCFSIGDGFSNGIIAHNGCFNPGGAGFGFVNVKSGMVATNGNLFDSNIATGGRTGFYVSNSNNDIFNNNSAVGVAFGLSLEGANGVTGTGNLWNALSPGTCGGCKDITIASGSSASLKDRAVNCSIRIAGTLARDSLITNNTKTCYTASDKGSLLRP